MAFHPWNSLCPKVQLNLLCNVFALSFSQAAVAHTSILTWLAEGRWSQHLPGLTSPVLLLFCSPAVPFFCCTFSLFSAWSPSVIQLLLVAGSSRKGSVLPALRPRVTTTLYSHSSERDPSWVAKMWGRGWFSSLLTLAGSPSALVMVLLLLGGILFFWWLMAIKGDGKRPQQLFAGWGAEGCEFPVYLKHCPGQ